jgi:hypothetical protein
MLEFTPNELIALLAAAVFVHECKQEAEDVEGALALSYLGSAHDKIAAFLNSQLDEELKRNATEN